MGTHIKFRYKNYADAAEATSAIKKGWNYLKKNPALPISGASLGLMMHNTYISSQDRKQNMNYRTKQLDAMNNLTGALNQNTSTVSSNSRALRNFKPGDIYVIQPGAANGNDNKKKGNNDDFFTRIRKKFF